MNNVRKKVYRLCMELVFIRHFATDYHLQTKFPHEVYMTMSHSESEATARTVMIKNDFHIVSRDE